MRIAPRDLGRVKVPDKTAEPFYATPEYRKWRAIVISRAHGVCQWPGCTRRERRMFADHILERRDRPDLELDPANGQCLCGSHHSRKTAKVRSERHQGEGV